MVAEWSALAELSLTNNVHTFTDSTAGEAPLRFYRLRE